MTAPSAPVIHAHGLGTAVRVSFPSVPTAATYRIYAGSTTAPTTLVVTGITALDTVFVPIDSTSYIRATAVNVGAEESAYSNEVVVRQPDAGRRIITHDPFGARDRRDT
jgi:hypothetical protein